MTPVNLKDHHAWSFMVRLEGAMDRFPLCALFLRWPTQEQLIETFRRHTLPWPTADAHLEKVISALQESPIAEDFNESYPVNLVSLGIGRDVIGTLEIRPVPVFDPERKLGVYPLRYT